MARPPVSWLLPARDPGPALGEAARSALAECGPADELVVVDDGSAEDLRPLLPDDPRVRLLRQPPRGIAAALELARRAARGVLLARIDADDLVLSGRIAAQLRAFAADPRLAAVGGRARIEAADGGPAPAGMRRYVAWVNGLRDLHAALLVESPLFHPATTLRARAVEAVGGWRAGDFPEDYDLWLRLAGAGWRLGAVGREVLVLRDHPRRLTRTDPRYRRAAFFRLKAEWLARHRLRPGMRVAVWGAGRTGRPWIRFLVRGGWEVVAVLDLKPGRTRQGVPVLPVDAVARLEADLLLVAVGAAGAREEIRARLCALRPDLVEGRDWLAVA